MLENGSLSISYVNHLDTAGQYSCLAVNGAGVARGVVNLKVFGGDVTFCCLIVFIAWVTVDITGNSQQFQFGQRCHSI